MSEIIYFDPINDEVLDDSSMSIIDTNDNEKNICMIEQKNNGHFVIKASNVAFGSEAKDYVLQTYQNKVNSILIQVKSTVYYFMKNNIGDFELVAPGKNNEKLKQKFQNEKEKNIHLINRAETKKQINIPKTEKGESDKFNINNLKNYFSRKNSEISKQYFNDTEVKEYQKNNTDIDNIQRELSGFDENQLKDVLIEDNDGDYNENMKDENAPKFGKLRRKLGMGTHILFAQAVIPTAEIQPSKEMFDRIQANYDKIKNKYKQNEDVVKSVDIQKTFLSNIVTNKGSNNVNGSELFSNELSTYFPEIITPFAVLNPNQSCVHFEKGSLGEIQKMFNLDSDSNDYMNNALINYPITVGNKLSDSSIFFKNGDMYYRMYLSTKAGRHGVGAQASVTGLNSYIFKRIPEMNSKVFANTKSNLDITKYTNYFTLPIKLLLANNRYVEEIKLLTTFSLTSTPYYNQLIDVLIKKYNLSWKVDDLMKQYNRNKNNASLKAIEWYMNNELDFTGLIMYLLKYASYDFAQVNIKQVSSIGESKQISGNLLLEDEQFLKTKWHYEFNIQYPAIFSGKVHMSFDMMNGKPKKLKFHILGNETSFS